MEEATSTTAVVPVGSAEEGFTCRTVTGMLVSIAGVGPRPR